MHLSKTYFWIFSFAVLFFLGCSPNKGAQTDLDWKKNSLTLEGYLSYTKEELLFISCQEDKVLTFLESDKKNELLYAYQQLDISNDFAYAKIYGNFTNTDENSFVLESFETPSKSILCQNGKIFFNPSGSFLNIRRGTHLYEVGERYGPLIGTKPDGKGNYFPNIYEMNLEGRIAVATFYTDEDKRILGYEVRDNQICLIPGVCPGKTLGEIREKIPSLEWVKDKEVYGLVVLTSSLYPVEFVLTESAINPYSALDDLPLDARLYLIRY
jgi:hypothetical protein